MIKVALTGGIGTGKSYLAHLIQKLGYPVFYSDEAAKSILCNDPQVFQALTNKWGKQILTADQQIAKDAIATLIFKNSEDRLFINNLIHPLVRARFAAFCKATTASIVFNEAALHFETQSYKQFDCTILVLRPLEARIKAICERSGMSENEISNRMATQIKVKDAIQLADFCIYNDEEHMLIDQLFAILATITSKAI